jgi:hypothetical protein
MRTSAEGSLMGPPTPRSDAHLPASSSLRRRRVGEATVSGGWLTHAVLSSARGNTLSAVGMTFVGYGESSLFQVPSKQNTIFSWPLPRLHLLRDCKKNPSGRLGLTRVTRNSSYSEQCRGPSHRSLSSFTSSGETGCVLAMAGRRLLCRTLGLFKFRGAAQPSLCHAVPRISTLGAAGHACHSPALFGMPAKFFDRVHT